MLKLKSSTTRAASERATGLVKDKHPAHSRKALTLDMASRKGLAAGSEKGEPIPTSIGEAFWMRDVFPHGPIRV